MLGDTHPDTHLHRHIHLRIQYTSQQHTAYTPRPEQQPPRCLPQRPPPGALLCCDTLRAPTCPQSLSAPLSALSLRCTQPPLCPTRHHLRFVQAHLYSSNRPSLPETHPLLTEPAPPHPIIKHRSLLCPKHFAPGFHAHDHSPFRSDPVLSHTCLPQNLPISGLPAPSTNPHAWGPYPSIVPNCPFVLSPHRDTAPDRARSTCPAAPPPGRPLAWACPHLQGCSPQRLIQQSGACTAPSPSSLLPEPSLLPPRWGRVRERLPGLSSAPL